MTGPDTAWERMTARSRKRLVWWLWLATWFLLLAGLFDRVFYEAVVWLTVGHALLVLALNRFRVAAFPVQVRLVYVVWVIVGTYVPHMTLLMYIPTLGLVGNLFFGYCPLARLMYLLPWNRQEAFSLGLVARVLLTPPTEGRFKPAGRSRSLTSIPPTGAASTHEGNVMKDLTIELENRPGALAAMGEVLGRAGVSIEGGGAWVVGESGAAHFLFVDGAAARSALESAGIRVLAEREVLVQRLKQDVPGQLGRLTRRMAEAGVNIEVLYSDHDHNLILVVDDLVRGREVSEAWSRETGALGA